MSTPHTSKKTKQKKPCVVCFRIRYFLIFSGLILILLWLRPDWRLPPGYDYAAIVGDLFLAAFLVVLAWKWLVYRRSLKQQQPDAQVTEEQSRAQRFKALRQAADAAEREIAAKNRDETGPRRE